MIDLWGGVGGGYFNPANYLSQSIGSAGSPWYMPQLSDWGGGIGGMGQIMGAGNTLSNMFNYRDPNQGWLGAGLQGALSGAGAGSMFGPIGAAIGAPIGYVAGKK